MENGFDTGQGNLIEDELEVVQAGEWGALIHFSGINEQRTKTTHGTYHVGDEETKVVFWGAQNCEPDERELLISNNNIVPQLLATKRNIILGGGLMAYREVYENGMMRREEVEKPESWKDFLEEFEVEDEYVATQAKNIVVHANIYTEFGKNKGGDWSTFKAHECRVVRAETQNSKGFIPRFHVSHQWGKITSQQHMQENGKHIQRIPNYVKGKEQNRFMTHGADKMIGGPYYYYPTWQGAWNWIRLANCIPEFHLANMKNGFNIRFIIYVPEDYFLRSLSEQDRKDTKNLVKNIKKAKQKFKDKINTFLAGLENAGRALIITKHMYKHLQQEMPEVRIEPLKYDMKDEAMLKLFESSNTATTSATGTPPALASIATGAKMTSGSEIRNLYNFYQLSQAPYFRNIILKDLRMALKMYREQGIHIGFRNIELTTTDKNPTGKAVSNTIEENPNDAE